MIGIIDYGSGNLGAIANIYKQLKVPHFISRNVAELRSAERYILPGVGAFDATMKSLVGSGLVGMLNEEVMQAGKKILGVCVGMQILATSSEEGVLPGLGWIDGSVKKIDDWSIATQLKLPHMGWNSVRLTADHPLFRDVDQELGFYFLHNYYFDASRGLDVVATARYGSEFPCAVVRRNVMGVQFHPEKSHHNGVAIFRNFAAL